VSKIVRRAKRRAQRAERVAQRAIPGGSDRWLDSRGLWNDPGSGRFVRRGFSSEKARAIDLIDARQVQLREALLAARDAHGDNGFVLVRAVDNRVGNVNRGDTVLVRLDPTNEDRVIIGGEHARYERGSRPRRYAVSINRFEFVAPEDRPDQMRLPQVNRDVPSATPVPETEVVEPVATGAGGMWGVADSGALAAWIATPSAGRDWLDPSVSAFVDIQHVFGHHSGGAIWRQGDRVFTWRPGAPVSARRDSGGTETVWTFGSADVRQVFPAADGSFLYQSSSNDIQVVRIGEYDNRGLATDFAVAAGDTSGRRLLDASPLPDGTWLTLQNDWDDRRTLHIVSVDAEGVQSTPVTISDPDWSAPTDTFSLTVVGNKAFLPNQTRDEILSVNLDDNTVAVLDLHDAIDGGPQGGNYPYQWEVAPEVDQERGIGGVGVTLDGKPGVLVAIERLDTATRRGYWFVSVDGTTSVFAENNGDGSNPLFDRIGGRDESGDPVPEVEPAAEPERFVPPEDRSVLRGANLSGRDLSGVDLSGYDLREANLTRANLTNVDLTNADLTGAKLGLARLSGARLTGARLNGASLRDATLNEATLNDAVLTGADLTYANLNGANLTDADLSGAVLINARLRDARLNGANLSGANFTGADLTGANLKDVVTDGNTQFPDGFVLPDAAAPEPATATGYPIDWSPVAATRIQQVRDLLSYARNTTTIGRDPSLMRDLLRLRFMDLSRTQLDEMADHLNVTENMPPRTATALGVESAAAVANWLVYGAFGSIDLDAGDGTVAPNFAAKSVVAHMETIRTTLRTGMFSTPDWERRGFVDDELYGRIKSLAVRDGENNEKIAALWAVLADLTNRELTSMTERRSDWRVWADANPIDSRRVIDGLPADFDLLSPAESDTERRLLIGALINALMYPVAPDMPSQIEPPERPSGPDADMIAAIAELSDLAAIRRRVDPDGTTDRVIDLSEPGLVDTIFTADGLLGSGTDRRYVISAESVEVVGDPTNPLALTVSVTTTTSDATGVLLAPSQSRYILSADGTITLSDRTGIGSPIPFDQRNEQLVTVATVLDRARNAGFVQARTTALTPQDAATAGFDWTPGTVEHLQIADMMADIVAAWNAAYPKDRNPDRGQIDLIENLIGRLRGYGTIPDRITDDEFPTPQEVQQVATTILNDSTAPALVTDMVARLRTQTSNYGNSPFTGTMRLVDTPVAALGPDAVTDSPPVVQPATDFTSEAQRAVRRVNTDDVSVFLTGQTFSRLVDMEVTDAGIPFAVEGIDVRPTNGDMNYANTTKIFTSDDGPLTLTATVRSTETGQSRQIRMVANLAQGTLTFDMPGTRADATADTVALQGWEPEFVRALADRAAALGFNRLRSGDDIDALTMAMVGFDWRVGGTTQRQSLASAMTTALTNDTTLTAEQQSEIRDLIQAAAGSLSSDPADWTNVPTPFALATTGWQPGSSDWFGRRAFATAAPYQGVIRFDPQDFDPEAAATSLTGYFNDVMDRGADPTAQYRSIRTTLGNLARFSLHRNTMAAAYEQLTGEPFDGISGSGATQTDRDGRTLMEALALVVVQSRSPDFVIGAEELTIGSTVRRRRSDSPTTGVAFAIANPEATVAAVRAGFDADSDLSGVRYINALDSQTAVLRATFGTGDDTRDVELVLRGDDPTIFVNELGSLRPQDRQQLTRALRRAGFGEIVAGGGDGYDLALRGFDWGAPRADGLPGEYDGRGHLRVADALEARLGDLPEGDVGSVTDIIRRLRSVDTIPAAASELPDVFPTPTDVARIGWAQFASTWVGREVLADPTLALWGRQNIQTVDRPEPYSPVLRRPAVDRSGVESTVTNEQVSAAYNFDLGDGYSVRSTVSGDGPSFSISGSIIAPSGATAGSFSRSANFSSGTLSHGSFSMNSSHRGSGVGRRFIAESVANMAALGVDQVVVSAAAGGSYNGSYTWARVGFDWRESYYPRNFGRLLRSEVARNPELSDDLRREALEMADLLENGWQAGSALPPEGFPTPNDLAVLGWEERNGNRWLGRTVISREGWGGVMRLSPSNVGVARPLPPRRSVRRDETRSTNVALSPQLARQIFDNGSRTSPVGLRVEVSGEPTVRTDPVSGVQSMTVEMMLLDPDGNERGTFQRELRSDGTATLDLSSVFPALQNRGHGYKILADQLEQLERNGFSRVQALAISAVEDDDEEDEFRLTGGYALARAGFDWASPRDARSIADELERVATAFGDTAPDEALEMVERLRSEEWDADGRPSAEFPTPNDVAMLGFAGDRSGSWFGKQLLLGELADPVEGRRSISWGAVARLDPPIGRQSAVFDPAVVPTLMTRRGNVDTAAAATAVRDGVRLWDVRSLRVPRSTSEYALAQLQTDLDSAPAPTEERREGRLGWWYSPYARNNPGLFRRGARIGRRGDRGAGVAFAGVIQREERPLQDRLTRLRRDARGTNRDSGFMSQDEAVNAQRAEFMEERLRSVLDNDPVLQQWMLNPFVDADGSVAPRTLLPLFVPTTAAVAQSQLVQPLTSGRENGAEFVGVEFPIAVADIDELDASEYEEAIRGELYRRMLVFWIQNLRETQDGGSSFRQLEIELRNAVTRPGNDVDWWFNQFGEFNSPGYGGFTAYQPVLLGQIITRVQNDPTFGDDANSEATREFFAEIRRMLNDFTEQAPTARTAAALPIDGDRDGFIWDGTKRERPAPFQMPKLDFSAVDVQRRLDEWEPPRPIDGAPLFERERQRTEELDRLMAQPKVDQIVKKPTESWSAEDAAYVAKYGTTKRQQRLALTAQARLAREAGNEELARSLEFQADRVGGSRKKRPDVPAAGSPERTERRMVGSAARKLMGRRKGSQPQDALGNIRKNDRFPELSDRELHEFAVALGRYPDVEVNEARSQMYWELARRAEQQGLGDAQRFYVTQARSGWFAEQERKGVDAPDSLFGSGDGNDDWVVAVLPDSAVLAGARGGSGLSDDERARFNRELASRSRSAGNDVLADGFERAAAGLEGGRSIDAVQRDEGVSGADLVERIQVEEGFTLDPRAEEFPTSGFSVAVSGFSAIITREEFEKPGVAEQFIADYLMKMRDDGVDDLFIGGWWDTENDEIVLDRVEVFDDEQEAIAAGRERNEQAIFDLANKQVIDTGGTGGREEIDIIGAEARSVPPEEAVQPDDGRGDSGDGSASGEPDAGTDRGTAGRPTTDEVNAAWETWSRNPADKEAARVLADGLFAHDLGDGITTAVSIIRPNPSWADSPLQTMEVGGEVFLDGEPVGEFRRLMVSNRVDADGQPLQSDNPTGYMEIDNTEFNVDDAFQGRGIGMRFFAAQVREAARDARFDRMTTQALSSEGGTMIGAYVWAKAGYDFDGGSVTTAFNDDSGDLDGGEYFLSLLEGADPDLWQRIMDDPDDITPADLAAAPAAADILKYEDVSWAGVYDLTAVTPEPVEPSTPTGGFDTGNDPSVRAAQVRDLDPTVTPNDARDRLRLAAQRPLMRVPPEGLVGAADSGRFLSLSVWSEDDPDPAPDLRRVIEGEVYGLGDRAGPDEQLLYLSGDDGRDHPSLQMFGDLIVHFKPEVTDQSFGLVGDSFLSSQSRAVAMGSLDDADDDQLLASFAMDPRLRDSDRPTSMDYVEFARPGAIEPDMLTGAVSLAPSGYSFSEDGDTVQRLGDRAVDSMVTNRNQLAEFGIDRVVLPQPVSYENADDNAAEGITGEMIAGWRERLEAAGYEITDDPWGDGGFPVSEQAVGRLSTDQIEALLAKGDVPANVEAWLSAELAGRTAVVAAASSGGGKYTKPALRERLKAKIMAGSKGGDPGEWSARKAQLLAQEYEAKGGGYRGGKSTTQRSLSKWTKEEWTTSDGKPSEGKRRYLPKEAWEKLTPAQKRATNAKKAKGTKAGKQFVANTEVAERAARLVREGKRRSKQSD
jgi:GNAT superfamily N-acetyltransferase